MWHIYRPTGNLLSSLAELVWFKPGLLGCISVLPLTRLLTSSVCSNVWGSEGIHLYFHTLRSSFRVGGGSGGSFHPSLSATCQIQPDHESTRFSFSTLLLEVKARRTWVCVCYSQGRSWGLQGPSAGCTSGPCLKLFNLYVHSIYLFVLFTQCLRFFKLVGVQVQKPNNQM